jgi:RNA polymerase sigma-70 factor (ECF subfamily)
MMDATAGTDAASRPAGRVAAGTAADDELVGAVAAGDRGALELLYRRHGPWLAGRLAARTSSVDLAEEALQDTFMAAWRGDRADAADTPEEAALGQDASARVRAAVARLPAEQRAAVTAVVYEGKSIQQAAQAAAVPEGTVKSRLHRARLHIRKELGP